MRRLQENFRPEFLNRIDEVIIFRRLEAEQLRQITELLLEETRRRLHAQDIEVDFTTAGDRLARRARLPAGVRRPPAAPDDPARGGQPAVPDAAGVGDLAGAEGHGGRPRRRARLRRDRRRAGLHRRHHLPPAMSGRRAEMTEPEETARV